MGVDSVIIATGVDVTSLGVMLGAEIRGGGPFWRPDV